MDQLEQKTFTTSRSITYTYYRSPSDSSINPKTPTLLLHHGFPDDAHLWAEIVPELLKLSYPLLIPVLLGYAGTSKPTDSSLYNYRDQSKDVSEILDAENISSVIVIGHDWGSIFTQRFYLFYPERVVGLILVNLAYIPPNHDTPFDLNGVNAITE